MVPIESHTPLHYTFYHVPSPTQSLSDMHSIIAYVRKRKHDSHLGLRSCTNAVGKPFWGWNMARVGWDVGVGVGVGPRKSEIDRNSWVGGSIWAHIIDIDIGCRRGGGCVKYEMVTFFAVFGD